MEATRHVSVGEVLDLATEVIGLERTTGRACLLPRRTGPPQRINGHNVGAPRIAGESPHGGELHSDGDELLFVISGRIRVSLELPDGDRTIPLDPGQATIVPTGTWHQIFVDQPGQLLHVTPGPGGAHRPRQAAS